MLGLAACERLGLITRVLDITKDPDITDEPLIAEYEDVFQGLGCLQGEIKITIDPDVTPVQHACRKVPFRLRDQVKHELDRMEQLGVIVKVEEPTDWVSNMVIVKKKSGDLRVCLDPKDLNHAIKLERFKLPSREEVMAEFADAKVFTKLDASSGFWQLPLDHESSKLTSFITPF